MASLPASAFAGAVTPAGTPITAANVRQLGVLQGYGDGRYVIGFKGGDGTMTYAMRAARTPSESGISGTFALDVRPFENGTANGGAIDPYADASPEMRGVIANARKEVAGPQGVHIFDNMTKGIVDAAAKNFSDAEAERRAQSK
jgi:hypothetical protein